MAGAQYSDPTRIGGAGSRKITAEEKEVAKRKYSSLKQRSLAQQEAVKTARSRGATEFQQEVQTGEAVSPIKSSLPTLKDQARESRSGVTVSEPSVTPVSSGSLYLDLSAQTLGRPEAVEETFIKRPIAYSSPEAKPPSVVKDAPFLTVTGQKQRLKRAAQSYELVGRRIADPFTEAKLVDKPSRMTKQDVATDILTSPAFVFGAPATVAAAPLVAPAAAKGTTTLVSTPIGQQVVRFGSSATKAGVTAAGLTTAGKAVGVVAQPKETKELFRQEDVTEAFYEARREAPSIARDVQRAQLKEDIIGVFKEVGQVREEGVFKTAKDVAKASGKTIGTTAKLGGAFLAEEIPAFGRPADEGISKALFERKLKEQGYSVDAIEQAASGFERKAFIEDVGQVAGVVGASREAEAFGRQSLKKAGVTGVTFGQKFMQVGGLVGQAGVFEGSSVELSSQMVRGEEIDVKAILGAGAIGGFSASTLGGIIGGFSGTKVRGPVFEATLDILDPTEPLGDISQEFAERGAPKVARVLTPSFTPSQSPTRTISVTQSGAVTTPVPTELPDIGLTPTPTPTKTKVFSSVPTITETLEPLPEFMPEGVGRRSRTKPDVPVQPEPFVPTEVQPQIPVQPEPFVPTQTDPLTQTMTQTQTQTFVQPLTQTFVSVPVVTAQAPILPFIPSGGSGRGARGRLRKVSQPKDFVSSLGASVLGIRGQKTEAGVLTGLGIRPLQERKRPKPRKKSGKKRKRR